MDSYIDRLVSANRRYAASLLPVEEARTPRLALILCMDARLDPVRFLGLRYGEAHIIRNAGGRMAEALRSLAVSQSLLGTAEVALIHHTECGMLGRSDEDIRAEIRSKRGVAPEGLEFLPFQDLEESLQEDLALYRNTAFLRQDIPVRGFIMDLKTGLLTEAEQR
jgi:carbonic anhydrase